ncbi:MAG: lipid-A-disaccharide synthase [Nitrospiraceae bacterium]|nr:lipid-A-disaccharide synthase [Nitrospiraceae bacterium]
MSKTLLIVAGESSGELYGSLLAAELGRIAPGVRIMGVGGERMEAEGVQIIRRVSGAFGVTELVSHLKDLRATFRELLRRVDQDRPQAAVLIDFPDFNFRAAAELKKRGVPVLYYVSPQIWAWRAGRIKKMKRLADAAALIMPFEEEIYRKAGIPHEFVGHPVLDEISGISEISGGASRAGKTDFCLDAGLDGTRPLLALLPGSRPSELKRHLPLFHEVMVRFKREFPDWQFFMPLAPNLETGPFGEQLRAFTEDGAVVRKGGALKALAASDAALIASGTATLQAAFLEKPFCVVYRLSPLTFFLGRMLVKVKYVSLVNILSGGRTVREFLQGEANPALVMAEMRRIAADPGYREGMASSFRTVRAAFEGRRASRRVAEMVCEMAGWR